MNEGVLKNTALEYENGGRRGRYLPSAERKAFAATVGFGLFGAITATLMVKNWGAAWPLVFFYAVLVFNTYFSVRAFSTIAPRRNPIQSFIDLTVVILYLGLATQFENPLNFTLLATILFLACLIKYTLLTGLVPHYRKFLRRKIFLDWLGVLLCILAMIGVAMHYSYVTTVAFALINAIANVYLLFIKPFYVLPL